MTYLSSLNKYFLTFLPSLPWMLSGTIVCGWPLIILKFKNHHILRLNDNFELPIPSRKMKLNSQNCYTFKIRTWYNLIFAYGSGRFWPTKDLNPPLRPPFLAKFSAEQSFTIKTAVGSNAFTTSIFVPSEDIGIL